MAQPRPWHGRVLSFSQVRHHYGTTQVLDGITFRVAPGRIVALIGPSGCGKTTTLHLAARLETPSGGTVENGFRQTALVFQEPRLLPWKTALDNAAFGLQAQGVGKAERRAQARTLLARLGLDAEAAERLPSTLSGGMRQRVGIARALATRPDLLLLDEPFNGLDVGLRQELHHLVRSLIDEASMAALVVTHDLIDALRMADHLLVLAPRPTHIVDRLDLPLTAPARSEAFLHETAANLLRRPAVAAVFAPRCCGARGTVK
ncbi:MAG: ATP-binding cassette domain-containing protein [Geminicoccaceae bacterium]|nr:MAG: ATP-binding cassette domain-containing protein [Geminicoccaceae bacterium]